MANIVGFIGIGLSGVVLLFSILAIALNYWQTGDIAGVEVNSGLWENCVEVSGSTTCTELDSDSLTDEAWTNIQAVRAMVMLGILLSTGAIVAGVLVMFVLKSTKLLFFVAGGLDIAAGLFLMIGMAVYVDKLKVDALDYGAAFALDILAWLLAWAAGGIFIGAKIMVKE